MKKKQNRSDRKKRKKKAIDKTVKLESKAIVRENKISDRRKASRRK